MARVIVTDHVFQGLGVERSVLEPLGVELVLAPNGEQQTLLELFQGGVDGLLVCFAKVGEHVVQAAADAGCRVISRYGIGYDNIDIEAATRNGIVVTRVPDYCLDEVADHAFALLLSAARGISAGQLEVRQGGWAVPREVFRMHGRRLALVGVGQIGARVATRAVAIGMEVVGFDPYLEDMPAGIAPAGSLQEAIADAHAISLHAPLTSQTHGMIGRQAIAQMRQRPIIVNTARGGLLDLDAGLAGLEDGSVSMLALDVVDPEPLPADHPLRSHPRAIITPHMAFYSVEAEQELQRRAAEEIARALRGEAPDVPVNPEALSRD